MGDIDQRINLIAEPRHFGGQQWYLQCSVTEKKCGADRFCSRQAQRRRTWSPGRLAQSPQLGGQGGLDGVPGKALAHMGEGRGRQAFSSSGDCARHASASRMPCGVEASSTWRPSTRSRPSAAQCVATIGRPRAMASIILSFVPPP